jgi:hypothetical protein
MVLYGLIGVNILKRKQAFKAISNDSFPMETVSHNDADLDDGNAPSQDGESVIISTQLLYFILIFPRPSQYIARRRHRHPIDHLCHLDNTFSCRS